MTEIPRETRESTKLTPSPENQLMMKYWHKEVPPDRVKEAMKHMHEAIGRLRANPQFQKKYENIDMLWLLPLMIKESFLDNSSISRTGAIWYFQLKWDAITDAHNALKQLWIQKIYDPKNPIENCILGIMYHLDTIGRMKSVEKDVPKDFVIFSYNVGVAKTDALIELYKKEHKTGSVPSWEIFALWLAKKIDPNAQKSILLSREYSIQYVNYFWEKDWSKDTSEIRVSQRYMITKSKIQEGINYVEKIRAIAQTDQSKSRKPVTSVTSPLNTTTQPRIAQPATKPTSSTAPQTQTQNPTRVLPYDSSRSEFHGDGLVDIALYWLNNKIGKHSQYGHIQAEKWDTIIKLLRTADISPTAGNIKIFREINRLDDGEKDKKDEDTIKIWAFYLVPLVSWTPVERPPTSGEVIRPTPAPVLTPTKPSAPEKPTPQSEIEKERLSRDFYKWIDTIEVQNNSLKGKTFILDPGHGWADPWAVPIAMKDGKPIPYKMSDIVGNPGKEKVVPNWKWDGHLRVVEARVVMDVAYRVAKELRESSATVKITHYFQKWIDNDRITESHWTDVPGLLDEIERYDTWWDGSSSKFDEWSRDGLRKRVRIRNKMQERLDPNNTYFISLHADRAPHNKKMSPNILYEPGNDGQRVFAHLLAENIWNIRNDQVTAWTREKWIHVLRESHGATSQNVLIELWNMNDAATSFTLRNSDKREEYAKSIFRWLHAVATRLWPVKVSEKEKPKI